MDIRVLKYFLAVAREANITRAAEVLHVTQPTLSRQLAKLEDELGVMLFERGKNGIALTNEGVLLRRRAEEITELSDKAEREIKEHAETIEGEIDIGSGELAAVMLFMLLPIETNAADGSNILVVYFSCTNTTEGVAQIIQELTGANIYEIIPEDPYTDEDLNYNDSDCRANLEQNDDSARPAISGTLPYMSAYDAIFIGYPIWWGKLPKIMYTFFDSCDLSGKTVIPFCTSGGSGIGTSVNAIKEYCPNVHDGLRRTSSTDESQIKSWLGID